MNKKVKYQTVDSDAMSRFWDAMLAKNRACSKFRSQHQCDMSVFVRRVLKKFSGKCYAVIYGVDTGATVPAWPGANAFDRKPLLHNMKVYVYVADIRYALGWGNEIEFTHCLAHPSKCILTKKLGYNDLLDLKYREIPLAEYKRVQSVFEDDSKEKK